MAAKLVVVEGALDEGPHDLGGDVGVGGIGEAPEGTGPSAGHASGTYRPAVACQTGQEHIGEAELRGRAPGADVA